MTIIQAVILGLVQGLCEFLPVSSSGHLLLLQNIFGITEGQTFFTVMLHLGTLLAVLIVYRKTILEILRHPFQKLTGYLLLATVPTVLIAILFKKVSPFSGFYEKAEAGKYLGVCFLITSALLIAAEKLRVRGKRRGLSAMRPKDALIIGAMQGLGTLSGVSRSGSTIAGALFSGLNRKAAADFSFLLSIIAIAGGAVLEIPDALEQGLSNIPWIPLIIGMIVAFLTGLFAIRLMLRVIKKKKLVWFAVYTAVLGILIILDQLVFHLFF